MPDTATTGPACSLAWLAVSGPASANRLCFNDTAKRRATWPDLPPMAP